MVRIWYVSLSFSLSLPEHQSLTTKKNQVGADRKSLRLGTMDYYIHILSAKGVYFLCLTEGSAITNPAATYGFLDQVMKNFEPSNYEGMSSKQDSDMRRLIGTFSSVKPHFETHTPTHAAKWNDPNVMVTAKLKNQLADITAKASKTVDALLTREKNLDNLLQKSDDLAQKAEEVRKVAEEVYWAMVWRVWKWQIIYFCGFLLLVLIIVAAVCGSGSC